MLPDHLWEQKCQVKMRQRASDPNPGLHVQPCGGLETANSAGQTLGWGVTQEGGAAQHQALTTQSTGGAQDERRWGQQLCGHRAGLPGLWVPC